MTQIKSWLQHQRRSAVIILVGGTLSLGLLLFQLGSLTNGISQGEFVLQQQYASLSVIAHNPVNLPLLLLHWMVGLWAPLTGFWLRVPSVVFAGLALAAMAYILRRWYGIRTALLAYTLFACTAWLLHVGRLATTDVMYLFSLPLLYLAHLLLHTYNESRFVTYLWLAAQVTLLYIPGGVWFVLLNAILQRGEIIDAAKNFRSLIGKACVVLTGLVLIAPLVVGLVIGSGRAIGLTLLGLPTTLPTFSQIGHLAADAVLFIAVRGNAPDALWLNHLPILDAFTAVTFVAGAYFYAKHWRANRTKLLLGSVLLGIILMSLGGPITIGIIVPVLFLIVAAGIAYLVHLWLSVFPRNPLARGLGVGVVSVAVVVSCLYGVRQYFVAWQYHVPAKASFSQREIIRPKL